MTTTRSILCVVCNYNQHMVCTHSQVLDRDALGVKDALAQRGIMVRHYAKKDLSNYVRISVGLPEHTDAVVAALKDMA